MTHRCVAVLVLLLQSGWTMAAPAHGLPAKADTDKYSTWRGSAARALAARGDADSLATAAALSFVGPPTRSKADAAKAAEPALDFAVEASARAPGNPAIVWIHLQFCAAVPACDIRDAATTMRWVDADNGAAWLPTLATAQRDRDTIEVDRVLSDMAQGAHFDLYSNRAVVMMFDALRRAQRKLPSDHLSSDTERLAEAVGIAGAATTPSFSPLINACREASGSERRQSCLKLSKTMQHADSVMAQLVGFAIERRLVPPDGRDARALAGRRWVLEWRVSAANRFDAPLFPWLKNARARSRVAKMRALPREEDVYMAILREHRAPIDPPEDR